MEASPGVSLRTVIDYFRDEQVPASKKVLALLAVAYVLSPIDLIPDVPIIGWLDDIGVMAFAAAHYMKQVKEYASARLATSKAAGAVHDTVAIQRS